jgi:acyl CoA:acetate/3-ketoacid CoA transferase
VAVGDGTVRIARHGEVTKLVQEVEQITFSGTVAMSQGQRVVYVTERAVFALAPDGMVLAEIAPGVDVRRDILERMAFKPLVPAEPAVMAKDFFTA